MTAHDKLTWVSLPLLVALVAGQVIVDGWKNVFEDTGPVWVSLAPPELMRPVKVGDTEVHTRWYGYRRRACANVNWWRTFERLRPDGRWAVIDKTVRPATSVTATLPDQEPVVYEIRLPRPAKPGDYRIIFDEVAECTPGRRWRNPVGIVHYIVPADGATKCESTQ